VKILDNQKKNKILGKRSSEDFLVFEITRIPTKKRGRKKLDLDESEK
jgi:hypothetical protein